MTKIIAFPSSDVRKTFIDSTWQQQEAEQYALDDVDCLREMYGARGPFWRFRAPREQLIEWKRENGISDDVLAKLFELKAVPASPWGVHWWANPLAAAAGAYLALHASLTGLWAAIEMHSLDASSVAVAAPLVFALLADAYYWRTQIRPWKEARSAVCLKAG